LSKFFHTINGKEGCDLSSNVVFISLMIIEILTLQISPNVSGRRKITDI
jgi:hypothetical protein